MRALAITVLLLLASLAGNGYQLYLAGGAKPKCDVKLAAQVEQQNSTVQKDQHTADTQRAADLKQNEGKINRDNASDAGEIAGLQQRVATQQETLNALKQQYADLKKQPLDPLLCLGAPVPAALLGGLHAGTDGAAQPRSRSHPL